MDSDRIEVPESAGLISFSRTSGQSVMFGSPFVHQHYITLRITKARAFRSSHEVQYMGDRMPYIEVAMSHSQFAEAITTINMGQGAPCTVKHINGQRLEDPWLVDDRLDFDSDVRNVAREAVEYIQELIQAIEEEKMSKKAQDRLIGLARRTISKLTDSLPFIAEMYLEHLDKLEQAAKTEISAYADMTVHQYGLGAIAQGMPQLPQGEY